jgi:hypothetical protein
MDKSTKISRLADGPLDLDNLNADESTDESANLEPVGIFAIGGIDE